MVIRNDMGVAELRRFAQGEADRRAALRALAIAQALEGASRADAARAVGRERQSLRDAVVRYNAEGLAGLSNRPRPGRPGKLTAAQRKELRAWVLAGPDPEVDGISSYRLLDIAAHIQERWAVSYGLSALSRMLRRMGLSWQATRPAHPKADAVAQGLHKNLAAELEAVQAAHPGKMLQRWCEDGEAPETLSREGQKGRTGHRWLTRGVRPPGRRDRDCCPPTSSQPCDLATTMRSPWCCPRQGP